MTDTGTGEAASIKLADRWAWEDRGATDTAIPRPSARQRNGWTARVTKPGQVKDGR
ncbi:MAG: hypothetical protein JWN97_1846 [Nocardioides sp.]|nr:hypothetical protein [Nocardioides sp.]